VRLAARLATTIDPVSAGARLPTQGMPQEVAKLTRAVNSAFDRVAELVRGQRIFTAAISHEVRTPLAMASLELEKIEDPRARKVEADLETLNRLVEQLTTLARLDGAELSPKVDLDPLHLAEGVVSALAPLVYESGRTIGLVDHGASALRGYPDLVENALRNLIENAIRHSAPSADIIVEVGPGRMLRVVDRSRTQRPHLEDLRPRERSRTGLGLRIVERIAALHGGSFDLATSRAGETVATLAL
jgi:signal transduction histidine kinase